MKKRDRKSSPRKLRTATEVVLAGRDPFQFEGFVNTPIYRGSTVLAPTVADYLGKSMRYVYGRRGTPTTDALAEAISGLEGAAGTALTPSGLSAITVALLSVLKTGDHLLVTDSAYGPTRHFCDTILKNYGVETGYYDPRAGAGIAKLFRPNTRAVFVESPGSLTFEMQDIPAIAKAAKAHGASVVMDNTWGTPIHFKPLAHGADISIQAGTKYLGGHADVNLGTIATTADYWPRVKETNGSLGINPGPEDVFLSLRGLRTLTIRLERHMQSGLKVARWLAEQDEVVAVLHPALESHPDHAIWKRDFSGACGLFSIVLKDYPKAAVAEFIEGLELFGIGASWGGFESLAIPFDVTKLRTATKWNPGGPCVRIHIGLEDPDDLMEDLAAGLKLLSAS
jgi:cysteine-S-conjugate beta-lyase